MVPMLRADEVDDDSDRADAQIIARKGATAYRRPNNNRSTRQGRIDLQQPLDRTYAARLPILHKPACAETHLAASIIETLTYLGLTNTWMALIPRQIGHSHCVDHGTNAVVKAAHAIRSQDTASQNASLRSYGMAVSGIATILSSNPSSDDALIAISLLAGVEIVLNPGEAAMWSHMRGISAVLELMMRRHGRLSRTASTIAHWHRIGLFYQPVALGRPSPFDQPQWWHMESAGFPGDTSLMKRFRAISHQLFCRLPRLIALVRSLRQPDKPQPKTYASACHLAHQLLQLEDEDAESELLHNVGVRATSDPFDAVVVPASLDLGTPVGFGGLIYYWQTRTILFRLCLLLSTLSSLHTSIHCSLDNPLSLVYATVPESQAGFDSAALEAANSRMARSMMMAWAHHFAQGRCDTWLFCLGMVTLWGALGDMPEYRGMPVSVPQTWVLQKWNSVHREPRKYDGLAMDEAAELLRGGPLKGFLVDAFK